MAKHQLAFSTGFPFMYCPELQHGVLRWLDRQTHWAFRCPMPVTAHPKLELLVTRSEDAGRLGSEMRVHRLSAFELLVAAVFVLAN